MAIFALHFRFGEDGYMFLAMLHIKQAIIVEGKYDKMKLDSLCEALVVPTYGFSIFTDAPLLAYIRFLAESVGIIILMDSDAAGLKIRNFLTAQIRSGTIRHAYIPAVSGKEKRKNRPSAEGTLGVEGVPNETLLQILSDLATPPPPKARPITMQDFYADGLSGAPNAAERRAELSQHLSLPPKISAKALLSAANTLLSYEAYREYMDRSQNIES